MRNDRGTESGFTLVEILVALVVTSFLLAIVMNASVTASDRGNKALARREAVLLAQAVVTRATVAPLSEGTRKGTAGQLEWSVEERIVMPVPRSLFALVAIKVTVENDRGVQLFSAETRKLKAIVRQ